MTSKKQKNNDLKQSMDHEVIQMGALRIERHGRIISISNESSEQERNLFREKAAELYPDIVFDIDQKISELSILIHKYHPVKLLQQSYSLLLRDSSNILVESNYKEKDIINLRMIDYVQAIIVSHISHQSEDAFLLEPNKNSRQTMFKQVGDIYRLINTTYHISNSARLSFSCETYNPKYDEIFFKAQSQWCNVRGQRYAVHDIPHLRDLLSPHDKIIRDVFSTSVEDILAGIEKISGALTIGFDGAIKELYEIYKMTISHIQSERGMAMQSDLTTEMYQEAIKKTGNEDRLNAALSRLEGFDLFDVGKITSLSDNLLQMLSLAPGEDMQFFEGTKLPGWPLRALPTTKKPLLRYDNRYYCFEPYTIIDNLYRNIQAIIALKKPKYVTTWNVRQKHISEELPLQLLKRILPNATIYSGVHYPCSSQIDLSKQDWCEADGIVLFDDLLIVVEVKGGAVSSRPPATNFLTYLDSLQELIAAPSRQSSRFIAYLESSEEAAIYNKKHEEIYKVNRLKYRNIFSLCVTIDNISYLAARASHLSPVGIEVDCESIILSIDDLRVYMDLFQNPLQFAHYLEQRKRAATSSKMNVADEIEHLSLYLEHNHYVSYAEEFDAAPKWHAYNDKIDSYYAALLYEPQNAKLPMQQEFPARLIEIIDILATHSERGCCRIAGHLLDFNAKGRADIASAIEISLHEQSKSGIFKPFAIVGSHNLVVFCKQPGVRVPTERLLQDYVYSKFIDAGNKEGVALHLEYDSASRLIYASGVIVSAADLSDHAMKIIKQKQASGRLGRPREVQGQYGKIGRNDACPCGSGRKYKKCHGID